MKKNTKCFTVLLFVCLSTFSYSQISFSDNTFLLSNEEHYSGVSMGIIDMNGDGLDDIVRQNMGVDLNIELQSQPGQKFKGIQGLTTGLSSQWSMCIADVDNNGTHEILTGGTNDEVVIIEMEVGSNAFSKSVLENSNNIFVQGSNFADIDNDGFVDVFVCHDNAESRIWGNNGSGEFISKDQWIDMSINGDSGEVASGNYGSTWLDIDNDGDIDLYIAKCRQGVTDVNDKRRINQLYINDGNGNFTEEASNRGLAVEWQSWTADFQDINNDGWLDCFVTNHDYESQVFLNDGTGSFIELMNTGIELAGLPIQGLMKDFDNDGWVDIITTGSKGQIFRNNGDLTFTEIPNLFDDNNMESLAVGDLNGDGYLDIYGGYAMVFTRPSLINDKLWMNEGGDNNFLTVTLVGEQSNRNGIGARVEIYGEWGIQIREVRSGESYGISNSNVCYFGLGQAEAVDSVVIHWPSGLVQTEYELDVNSKVKIREGRCLGKSPVISFSGPTAFCSGESVTLSAEDGFTSYAWTNGGDGQSVTISNSGNYTLEVVDSEGCLSFSENISISVDPEQYPKVVSLVNPEICEGSEVELEVLNVFVDEEDVAWSTGATGFSFVTNSPGEYFANVTGLCSDFESNSIKVIVNEFPDAPEAEGDSIKPGEVAVLNGEGDNLAWYESELSEIAFGYGASVEVGGLTENSLFYVEERSGSGINGNVGMVEHEGTLYSQNPNFYGGIKFDVYDALVIDSVKVYTDLSGPRKIVLQDRSSQEITSILVDIEEGESTIYLGFEIPEGEDYLLVTDFFQNLQTTGDYSPRLQRSDQNVNFPYTIDDKIEIKGSAFGQEFYYYFYDWTISAGVFCASDRTEVKVAVEGSVSVKDGIYNQFNVYPNPNTGAFTIQFSDALSNDANFAIFDMNGKRIYKGSVSKNDELTLDLNLTAGLYFLRILDGSNAFNEKIIVE